MKVPGKLLILAVLDIKPRQYAQLQRPHMEWSHAVPEDGSKLANPSLQNSVKVLGVKVHSSKERGSFASTATSDATVDP